MIVSKEKELIFVEIKYRSRSFGFDPRACVGEKQKANIKECAKMFLVQNLQFEGSYCRFDVILVVGDRDSQVVEHIKYAFV